MTDKQLDEMLADAFGSVHADASVKARIKKGLMGDSMEKHNTHDISVSSAVRKNDNSSTGRITVNRKGSVAAACVAALLAVGGGMFLLNNSFDNVSNTNDRDSSAVQRTAVESAADSKTESRAENAAKDTEEDKKEDKETTSEDTQNEPVVITYVNDDSAETKADKDTESKAETKKETKPETVTTIIYTPAEETADNTANDNTEETAKPAEKQSKILEAENDGLYWVNDDRCLIKHDIYAKFIDEQRDKDYSSYSIEEYDALYEKYHKYAYDLYDASSDRIIQTFEVQYETEPVMVDNGFALCEEESLYSESMNKWIGVILTATVYDPDGNIRYNYKVDTHDCVDNESGPEIDDAPVFIADGSNMIIKVTSLPDNPLDFDYRFFSVDGNDNSIKQIGATDQFTSDNDMFRVNDDVFAFLYTDDKDYLAYSGTSSETGNDIVYNVLGTGINAGRLKIVDGILYYISADEDHNVKLMEVKPDDSSNEAFNINGTSYSVTEYDMGKLFSEWDYSSQRDIYYDDTHSVNDDEYYWYEYGNLDDKGYLTTLYAKVPRHNECAFLLDHIYDEKTDSAVLCFFDMEKLDNAEDISDCIIYDEVTFSEFTEEDYNRLYGN